MASTTTANKTEEGWKNNVTLANTNEVDGLVPKYQSILDEMRNHFRTGQTKTMAHRKLMATQMLKLVTENHDAIGDAVRADQGGPKVRGLFEMDVISKVHSVLDNWETWCEDEFVATPGTFLQWARIRKEAKGVMLIIAPWNFPFGVTLTPLMMMLVMGNCVVVKPSEVAPNSSRVMATLLPKYFPSEVVRVLEGGVSEVTALLRLRWDHILYTGNGAIGRIVMQAAAKHLTPVTLELGGKSPVIVDESADLKNAAAKLILGKFILNSGQVCIAPDFVLVHESKEKELLSLLKTEIETQLGDTVEKIKGDSSSRELSAYGRIVHPRHIKRLEALLEGIDDALFVVGNPKDIDNEEKFIPPMIVTRPPSGCKLLQQEIFGPILPVLPYTTVDDAIAKANEICASPLALYIFSESSSFIDTVLGGTTSGGVCVNTTEEHFTHPNLPFGGVGESGMGCYGSKYGIDEFSHRRSVLTRTTHWAKELNSGLPYPSKGQFPKALYGIVHTVMFGFVSRDTKMLIKTIAKVAVVGGAAWFAKVYFM
eukprot:m.150630 g.150630  ORF g.150630 m.150630 type:complete len:539 (+) comp30737_c0_seq2:59-1675(+)